MKDTLTERDLLDPADALLVTALEEVQKDDSPIESPMPACIETAVFPIPDP